MTLKKRKKETYIQEVEHEIVHEIEEIEEWIIERKKFFIKLALVVAGILLLLGFSHLYLS